MATFDFIILAIVLLSAIVGLVRGFLREICSLVTWVLAIGLAWRLGPLLEPYLGGLLRDEPYGLWAGRAIVFVTVLVAGAVIASWSTTSCACRCSVGWTACSAFCWGWCGGL